MIAETGDTQQFKECLLDNIASVRCDQCGRAVMILDCVPQHDTIKLLEACDHRLCCLNALTEDWLRRVDEMTRELLKSEEAKTLVEALKLYEHSFLLSDGPA